VRNVADGFGTGLFANCMSAHAVRHQEEVPMLAEALGVVAGGVDGVGVLIVAATQSYVGTAGVLDRVESSQCVAT